MLKQQDHLQVGQKRKKGRGKFARIKKRPSKWSKANENVETRSAQPGWPRAQTVPCGHQMGPSERVTVSSGCAETPYGLLYEVFDPPEAPGIRSRKKHHQKIDFL